MNTPSILAITTVLAITAGLVNAASQTPVAIPNSTTSSAAQNATTPVTLEQTQGTSEQPEAAGEPAGSEQADANESTDNPQDGDQSDVDAAPEAPETAGK